MFSSDINTRDLFFSNPIDHFLAQDQEIKTSFESGFSSSHNQTGNSKEMQYRSSQDLFNQTRSQDLFSQNERTNSQFGARNLDYQMYISQNLLLGKESPRSILSFNDREKETIKEIQVSPVLPKEFNENLIKEIKTSIETLNDDVRKLNSDTSLQNNNLQEELLRLNEKISFVEKNIGLKVEFTADNYKTFTTIIKKEEDDKKRLYDKISEVAENVEKLDSKIEDLAERHNKMLQENIKKISKNYEAANKKQLQKIQDQCSQMNKVIQKLNSKFESSMKNIQENLENSLDKKFNSLKDYLNQSVQLLGKCGTDSLINKRVSPKSKYDIPKDDFDCNKFKKTSTTMSNYSSNYGYRNARMAGVAQSSSMKTTQTPLAHFLNNAESMQKYETRSTVKPEISSYKDTLSYSNLKIKRKFPSPLRKMTSPLFRKPMQNATNSYCTPLISKLPSNKPYETFFHRNETVYPNRKYGGVQCMERTTITNSSPALTVFEAATIAKRLYAFHSHHTHRK